MSVNGEKYNVAFIPTPDDNTPGTAALTIPLKKGAVNLIEFEAYNGGWGKFCFPVSNCISNSSSQFLNRKEIRESVKSCANEM